MLAITPLRPASLVLLLSLVCLSGCVTAVITPEMESEYGGEMSREVEDQMGLYDGPELDAYVNSVGQRLVASLGPTPYTFHFAVVDQFEPNAFASPGGYIYVSRGLLAAVNDEMELAGVLAHEISHVTQRHHTRQAGRNLGAGLLTLPGRAVGLFSEGLGNIINAPIEAAGDVFLASYSRGQETEADDYGMRLAARAGYNPIGLGHALLSIERTVEHMTGKKHEASFFDSHPTTPTRLTDINEQITAIPLALQPPIANREELYKHLDGLWWGKQNPQGGVFSAETFLNADLNFTITFTPGWKTVNTPRFVGANEPDGGAFIALGGNNSSLEFEQLADALVDKMRAKARLEPAQRRSFLVGDWPAQLVRYDDSSGSETVSMYYLFVDSPRMTFTLMAMGLERYRDDLVGAVSSLRQLTEQEAASIKGQRLRLAQIRPGETLSAFSRRVANQWAPELTAILNGLEPSSKADSEQLLKIMRSEQYRSPKR